MLPTSPVIADINLPIVKAATAITAAVGANTQSAETIAMTVASSLATSGADSWWYWFIISIPWAPIASCLAAFYSAMVCGEWLWKKAIRPFAVAVGWLKPKARRVFTEAEIRAQMEALESERAAL